MKIASFNTDKGFYLTHLSTIETEIHSHPAIEFIFSQTGKFDFKTNNGKYSSISFAIIDANKLHKLKAQSIDLTIFIVENKDNSVKDILLKHGINLESGIYVETEISKSLHLENIINNIIETADSSGYDNRVLKAIEFMDRNEVSYNDLIKLLLDATNLSESRLSHLFKQNTGVSLKKYYVWSKLKKVVSSHLQDNLDLYSAMLQYGFYDQAHFSKSYKSMIGINPSLAYKKSK